MIGEKPHIHHSEFLIDLLSALDPGLAPASRCFHAPTITDPQLILYTAGTPEAGGWTTREVKRIIRGLAGLNFVYVSLPSFLFLMFHLSLTCISANRGADVVEVAPAYDHGKPFLPTTSDPCP